MPLQRISASVLKVFVAAVGVRMYIRMVLALPFTKEEV